MRRQRLPPPPPLLRDARCRGDGARRFFRTRTRESPRSPKTPSREDTYPGCPAPGPADLPATPHTLGATAGPRTPPPRPALGWGRASASAPTPPSRLACGTAAGDRARGVCVCVCARPEGSGGFASRPRVAAPSRRQGPL